MGKSGKVTSKLNKAPQETTKGTVKGVISTPINIIKSGDEATEPSRENLW